MNHSRQKIFIGVAILSILVIPFTIDRATSVVPGWHTTIYMGPQWFHFVSPVYFLLISLIYRLIEKAVVQVSNSFFVVHVLLSILLIGYVHFPYMSYFFRAGHIDGQMLLTEFKMHQLVSSIIIILQLAFTGILLGRILCKRKKGTDSVTTS